MVQQLLGNWLCWAILILALVCYQQLWSDFLVQRSAATNLGNDAEQQSENSIKANFSGVLIGALPLMGLLGTIIGLLECFAGIAQQGASSELISSGIADALLTTQLGLVCAIPGWLLQAYVRRSRDLKIISPTASNIVMPNSALQE